MICLDTNYLILGLTQGSKESKELVRWYQAGEALVTPMPAWYEFLCGPVSKQQVETMRAFLTEIVPFGEEQAEAAAQLFESAGRKRALRVDAMIAATAMVAQAELATNNRNDSRKFSDSDLLLL